MAVISASIEPLLRYLIDAWRAHAVVSRGGFAISQPHVLHGRAQWGGGTLPNSFTHLFY